jgi:FdhE protein
MNSNLDASVTPIRPADEPPRIIPPDTGLIFSRRAARFDQLAEGHALAGWLRFLAALTRAQHDALQTLPALALPDANQLALAREYHMPPLPAQSWSRDPVWRSVLKQIAAALRPLAPDAARQALDSLMTLPEEVVEALADRVLHADLYGEDAAQLPYVAAALQVLWTAGAARLGSEIVPLDVPGVCPCCGFLPVASVVKGIGSGGSPRYLHCALCNTEWNLVRIKCATCDADADIGYRHLEGEGLNHPDAVRAETCEACKSYLKIIYPEKGALDPVADDLATLALDILVDEAGYARSGPNLLLAGLG